MAGQRQVAWGLASPPLARICHYQTSWEVYYSCSRKDSTMLSSTDKPKRFWRRLETLWQSIRWVGWAGGVWSFYRIVWAAQDTPARMSCLNHLDRFRSEVSCRTAALTVPQQAHRSTIKKSLRGSDPLLAAGQSGANRSMFVSENRPLPFQKWKYSGRANLAANLPPSPTSRPAYPSLIAA